MKFKYFVLLKQQLRFVVIVIVYQDRYGVANVQSLVGVIANLVRTIVGASVHRVLIDSFVFRPDSSAVEWPHVGDDGLDSHSIVVVEIPPLAFGYRNDDATQHGEYQDNFLYIAFLLGRFLPRRCFFHIPFYYMLCIILTAGFCCGAVANRCNPCCQYCLWCYFTINFLTDTLPWDTTLTK